MTTKTEPKPKKEMWQAIANREASRITHSEYKKKVLKYRPKHRKVKP